MKKIFIFATLFISASSAASAHGNHNETPIIKAIPAAVSTPKVSITKNADEIIIKSNGVPNHKTGQFPSRNNPNSISAQDYTFKITAKPQKAPRPTAVKNRMDFGVALNGVPFDPGTAEYWKRDRNSGWVEEGIINGQKMLGIDENNAHVQPNGAYHYHGKPMGMLTTNDVMHVGYAADGFKIYASTLDKHKSGYRLRTGLRSAGTYDAPPGRYDGTYTQDFDYFSDSGALDRCNGTEINGEYAYILTETFPFVPRCWVGTPDPSFKKEMIGRGPGSDGRRPPPHGRDGRRPPPPRF